MNRERALIFFLIIGCFTALIIACFGDALFRGRQFGYRDAGHFYYPLYERVQQEWNAGRWPLWEPEENSGMPLLGNPTAAVLYPGKVIFALPPYPLAARLYVVAHLVLEAETGDIAHILSLDQPSSSVRRYKPPVSFAVSAYSNLPLGSPRPSFSNPF